MTELENESDDTMNLRRPSPLLFGFLILLGSAAPGLAEPEQLTSPGDPSIEDSIAAPDELAHPTIMGQAEDTVANPSPFPMWESEYSAWIESLLSSADLEYVEADLPAVDPQVFLGASAMMEDREVVSTSQSGDLVSPAFEITGSEAAAEFILPIDPLPGWSSDTGCGPFEEACAEVDESSAAKVTHLKQVHSVGSFRSAPEKLQRDVIESQLKIISYLRKNPSAVVVLESLTQNLNQTVLADLEQEAPSTVMAAKLIFADGIPKNSDDLTDLQYEFLYEYGAVRTMFLLGELKRAYASLTAAQAADIDLRIRKYGNDTYGSDWPLFVEKDTTLKKLIFDDREKLAADVVDKLVGSGNKQIAVIFGAKHDLAKYFIDRTRFKFHSLNDPQGARPALLIRPFEYFYPDYLKALYFYSGLSRLTRSELKRVLAEQSKILAYLTNQKKLIDFWIWAKFRTSKYKAKALARLDPGSIQDNMSMELFLDLISADSALQNAGTKWLTEVWQKYNDEQKFNELRRRWDTGRGIRDSGRR